MVRVLHQELCPSCHVSISIAAHPAPFFDDSDRAFSAPPTDASSDSVNSDLAMVTTEISRLRKVLKALCKHRDRLQTHRNQLLVYSLPSPFRRLPTELLSHIFSFCCNSVTPELWKTPLSISQTCFKWRSIALATPQMWSHLYVGPNISSKLPHLQRLFLQRAGSETPLSLRLHRRHLVLDPVDIDSLETPDLQKHVEDAIDLLFEVISLSHRLLHLELQIPAEDCDLIANIPPSEFPLLESLTVALDCRFDNVGLFPDEFMFAPRLRAISVVDEEGSSLPFFEKGIPWNRLTHITTNVESLYHLNALDDSEDQVERTIHWNCVSLFIFASPPYHYANVTSLVVCPQAWRHELVTFFKTCRMSALQDLTLEEPRIRDSSWGNVLEALPKFVEASEHGLRSLRIVLSPVGPKDEFHGWEMLDPEIHRDFLEDLAKPEVTEHDCDLLATLAYTPTLKTLRVVESVSGAHILTEELFEGILRDGLVPNLRHLELVWSPSHEMPEDSLLEMLARQTRRGLESVVLGVREGGEVSRGVREFMNQGTNGLRATLW